jgi:hypothetical protein
LKTKARNNRINRRTWMVRALAVCLIPCVDAVAATGVAVAPAARVGDITLVLNGAGMRRMFMTDVYVIALYLAERKNQAAAIFSAPGPKRIALRFMREVTAQALVDALFEGLRDNTSESEFMRLRPAAEALSAMILPFKLATKGDIVTLDYLPATGSHIVVNGHRSAKGVPGHDLYEALLRIWLGDKPVDANLKRALLGL